MGSANVERGYLFFTYFGMRKGNVASLWVRQWLWINTQICCGGDSIVDVVC